MTSIKVPPLGESIVEATVSRWLKSEGDAIAPGDTLVELETDKITVEVPSVTGGVLKQRFAKEGDVVKLDQLLAEVDEKGDGARPAAPPSDKRQTAAPAAPPAPASSPPRTTAPASSGADARVSPAAQRVAQERGVDLSPVSGTGRGGVVTKADVLAAAKPATTPPQPSATPVRPIVSTPRPAASGERETREKMTTRRKRIAENLLESQHATAHLTTFNEIDMSVVETLRGRVKERIEKEHGVRLSFMPFFVKAAIAALKQFPVVNAQIDGDSIVYRHYVNMGIAVAAEQGLVVPN